MRRWMTVTLAVAAVLLAGCGVTVGGRSSANRTTATTAPSCFTNCLHPQVNWWNTDHSADVVSLLNDALSLFDGVQYCSAPKLLIDHTTCPPPGRLPAACASDTKEVSIVRSDGPMPYKQIQAMWNKVLASIDTACQTIVSGSKTNDPSALSEAAVELDGPLHLIPRLADYIDAPTSG